MTVKVQLLTRSEALFCTVENENMITRQKTVIYAQNMLHIYIYIVHCRVVSDTSIHQHPLIITVQGSIISLTKIGVYDYEWLCKNIAGLKANHCLKRKESFQPFTAFSGIHKYSTMSSLWGDTVHIKVSNS